MGDSRHSHSNMGDLVTIIEIWVTCTCLTMNAHTATMKNEDYKTMDYWTIWIM